MKVHASVYRRPGTETLNRGFRAVSHGWLAEDAGKEFASPVRCGLDPSTGHCAGNNGPGSDARRIADDDSDSSAAIFGDDGQLNARQMESGYYLVNLAGS